LWRAGYQMGYSLVVALVKFSSLSWPVSFQSIIGDDNSIKISNVKLTSMTFEI